MRLSPIALTLLLTLTSMAPARAQDSAARKRVDAWILAAGGPKVWDSIHDLTYTITTVWYDTSGAEVRRRPRYVTIKKIPGSFRVRVERDESAGHFVQVWDGAGPWASLSTRMLDDTAQTVREVRYVAGDLAYWIGLPWKLSDPGVSLQSSGDSMVAVTFGSGVGFHDRDRYWYIWRDARSPFPTEVDYIEQGHPDTDRQRVLFAEWKKEGPVMFAVKRVTLDTSARPLRALVITDIKANKGVKDALFAR